MWATALRTVALALAVGAAQACPPETSCLLVHSVEGVSLIEDGARDAVFVERGAALRVTLKAAAADRGPGEYVAINSVLGTDGARVLAMTEGMTKPDFDLDLGDMQEAYVMYVTPTEQWTLKAVLHVRRGSSLEASFDADTTSFLGNPGAGFSQVVRSQSVGMVGPDPQQAGVHLYWWNICLNNGEAESDVLPAALLRELYWALAMLRVHGKQVYLRFWYNALGESTFVRGSEPPLSRIHSHQRQIAEVLRPNLAAIAGIDAGMLGADGEWHKSAYGDINSISLDSSLEDLDDEQRETVQAFKSVVDRWFFEFPNPEDPPVQLRRVLHKNLLVQDPVLRGRTNYHIDCALSSPSDTGTFAGAGAVQVSYGDKQFELTGLEERFALIADSGAAVGGETCFNADAGQLRLGCEAALAEFRLYHWGMLNELWYPDFVDSWKAGGCFETIRASLGYRWHVEQLKLELGGSSSWLSLRVHNLGWAASPNVKLFYLVLSPVDGGAARSVRLDTLPGWVPCRRWLPGQPVTMSVQLAPTEPIPPGAYRLALQIREPVCLKRNACISAALSTRLANIEGPGFAYDTGTGLNDLMTTVVLATPLEPPADATTAPPVPVLGSAPGGPVPMPEGSERGAPGTEDKPTTTSSAASRGGGAVLGAAAMLAASACRR